MKKVVFKALLLIIAFTNVAMAALVCTYDEVLCKLESSDIIGRGYNMCVYSLYANSSYTISVTYKGVCPLVACYNIETGKVRFTNSY